MKTKWNLLMVLVLLGTLVGGSASEAQAQGGITGVSPEEGTVGVQVTITGSGFGDKHGEILLGEEKCKVLDWSDTQITFLVDKPQAPGGYPVTVLLQGDKKPEDPLAPALFTMRRPEINPGELLLDGSTATVLGSFFGDKKGALRLGYLESGEAVTEDLKILDWSMNTIRFELPAGLSGKFVLVVSNEVGAGLALLDLGGAPSMLGDYNPPKPSGFGHLEGNSNSSGVFFKGVFYIFSTDPPCIWSWCNGPIRFRKYSNGVLSDPLPITKGETNVTPVPLVVGDKLWLFHTAADKRILYTVFDGISWDNHWHATGYKTASDVNEMAAVYNPETHRITVYYRDGTNQLGWGSTSDYGQSWSSMAVTPAIKMTEAPSAVYYKGTLNGAAYDTLVAVNSSGKQYVYALQGNVIIGTVYSYTADANTKGRPFLVDDLGSNYIYLIVYWNNSQPYNVLKDQVFITRMSKSNNTWTTFYKKITLPPGVRDGSIGFYYFNHYWSPNGAINYEYNSTTGLYDRKLYAFYGWAFSSWDFQTVLEPVWTGSYIEAAGQGIPSTPLPAPTFISINGGQYNTCAVRGDNIIDCWGKNSEGQSNQPDGAFLDVSPGTWHTCGVKTNGAVACWGDDDGGRVSSAPTTGGFTQVSLGDWHGCGLKSNGSVDCWGSQDGGRTDDKTGPFKQISSGNWHNCGVRKDTGLIECWGIEDGGRISDAPDTDTFTQVSAGDWHNCGVRTNGTLLCWGDNDASRVKPLPDDANTPGTYKQVAAGNWHTCALRNNGTIVCWGSNDDNRVTDTPTASGFTQLDAGDRHTCAIQNNNKVVCWGNNGEGQSDPPY